MFAPYPPAQGAFPDVGFLFLEEVELKSELVPAARSFLNKRASTRGLLTTECTSLPTSSGLFVSFFFFFFWLPDFSVLSENMGTHQPFKL